MIFASNAEDVFKDLDRWMEANERKVEVKLKVITGYALKWLAEHSPQYSGDFAANWKVCVNGIGISASAALIITNCSPCPLIFSAMLA